MIIGAGSAAFAAAIKAAEMSSRIVMLEQSTIGGTCVNIGCVPSKTLIKAAEVCYHATYSNVKGMAACPPPSEWQTIIKQKDKLVAELREEKYINVLEGHPNVHSPPWPRRTDWRSRYSCRRKEPPPRKDHRCDRLKPVCASHSRTQSITLSDYG